MQNFLRNNVYRKVNLYSFATYLTLFEKIFVKADTFGKVITSKKNVFSHSQVRSLKKWQKNEYGLLKPVLLKTKSTCEIKHD